MWNIVVNNQPGKANQIRQIVYANFDAPTDGNIIFEYRFKNTKPVAVDSMSPWLIASKSFLIDGNQYVRILHVPGSESSNYKIYNIDYMANYGQWYEGTIDATVKSAHDDTVKFNFYVDNGMGSVYKSGLETQAKTGTNFQKAVFGLGGEKNKGGELWFDDIKVYVNPILEIAGKINAETIGVTGDVTADLNLPEEYEGASLSYISSNPEIIATDGTVNRPAETEAAASVTLWVVVEKDGYRGLAEIPLTVMPKDDITTALDEIDIAAIVGQDQTPDTLTTGFQLPKTAGGFELSWASSDVSAAAIDSNGKVSVFRGRENKPVTLTATITSGERSESRNFALTVAAVTSGETGLDINEIVGQDLNAVTNDFSLPSQTSTGKAVEWMSSDMHSLFVHNDKAYVIRSSEDKKVKLVAAIDMGEYSLSESYDLTIANMGEVLDVIHEQDFQDTEPGTLPTDTLEDGTVIWQADSSLPNPTNEASFFYTVVDEANVNDRTLDSDLGNLAKPNPGNKVLRAGNLEGSSVHGVVHSVFNAPAQTVTSIEYDIYSPSKDYGHIWFMNNPNPTMSGDLARIPTRRDAMTMQGQENYLIGITANQWHHVKFTIDMANQQYDLYIDGKMPSQIVDQPRRIKANGVQLAQLAFGYASGAKGYYLIDNFKVATDIVKSVDAYANSIELKADLTELINDFILPQKTTSGEANITWISSDESALKIENGKAVVTRPASDESDVDVTLYALVEKDGVKSLKEYDVTVKREKTDQESVDADFEKVDISANGFVLHDFDVPVTGTYGSQIIWTSSHPELINPNGPTSGTAIVTPKDYDNKKITQVILSCIMKKGEAQSEAKTFTFNVPEMNYALEATVLGSSDRANARFAFVSDNNSSTYWSPKADDMQNYLTLTLPEKTKINYITTDGSYQSVKVSYSEGGTNFTSLGSGSDISFDAVNAKKLKFEFAENADGVKVNDIGVYYVTTDKVLATEAAQEVEEKVRKSAGGSFDRVTSDLELPIESSNGSSVSWSSSNPQYLSNTGKVTQPAKGESAAKAVLTMTVKYGEATVVRTLPQITIPAVGGSGGGGTGGGSGSGGSGGGGGVTMPVYPSDVTPPTTSPTPGPDGTGDRFSDIADVPWAKEAIETYAEKGYISGSGNSLFEPMRNITRAEFLKVLLNAFHLEAETGEIAFSDVKAGDWYYGVVSAGCALGIVNGMGDGSFGANEPVTRQDMSVMAAKAAQAAGMELTAGEERFADSGEISEYASASVSKLVGSGALSGYEDGTFRPQNHATRAEAVVVLYRLVR